MEGEMLGVRLLGMPMLTNYPLTDCGDPAENACVSREGAAVGDEQTVVDTAIVFAGGDECRAVGSSTDLGEVCQWERLQEERVESNAQVDVIASAAALLVVVNGRRAVLTVCPLLMRMPIHVPADVALPPPMRLRAVPCRLVHDDDAWAEQLAEAQRPEPVGLTNIGSMVERLAGVLLRENVRIP